MPYQRHERGYYSSWAQWGRQGAKMRSRDGIKSLSDDEWRQLAREGRLDLTGGLFGYNQRRAHCKRCATKLSKGEGLEIIITAPNGYNVSFYYLCQVCLNIVKEVTNVLSRY